METRVHQAAVAYQDREENQDLAVLDPKEIEDESREMWCHVMFVINMNVVFSVDNIALLLYRFVIISHRHCTNWTPEVMSQWVSK